MTPPHGPHGPRADLRAVGHFPTITRGNCAYPDPDAPAAAGGLPATACALTAAGARSLADLLPGDRVITRDGGIRTLRGLLPCPCGTQPMVRIPAGALGTGRPARDLHLPSGQRLLLRGWRAQALYGAAQALVPAARLVEGRVIAWAPPGRAPDLLMPCFEAPHILYIEGLELAT